MIYLSGCVRETQQAHPRPDLGFMMQPGMGNKIDLRHGVWAADNGCFSKTARFDAGNWLAWLASLRDMRESCLFATTPDVRGDWEQSIKRSAPYLPTIAQLGYKVALVAQDGMPLQYLDVGGYDALFIGGNDEWKFSEEAYALAEKARKQGRWIHQGRVNSFSRLRGMRVAGFDSADGTFVKWGPDRNLPKVYDWLDEINFNNPLLIDVDS